MRAVFLPLTHVWSYIQWAPAVVQTQATGAGMQRSTPEGKEPELMGTTRRGPGSPSPLRPAGMRPLGVDSWFWSHLDWRGVSGTEGAETDRGGGLGVSSRASLAAFHLYPGEQYWCSGCDQHPAKCLPSCDLIPASKQLCEFGVLFFSIL